MNERLTRSLRTIRKYNMEDSTNSMRLKEASMCFQSLYLCSSRSKPKELYQPLWFCGAKNVRCRADVVTHRNADYQRGQCKANKEMILSYLLSRTLL